MNSLKKMILSGVLAGGFIVGAGAFSNADAQNTRWKQNRRVQVDRNGNIDRRMSVTGLIGTVTGIEIM
jgi:hypothetical protein